MNVKFLITFFILAMSCIVFSADIESQYNKRQLLIKELSIDNDLKDRLFELALKDVDELNYYDVTEILNEQQKRCSESMGFIVHVSTGQVISINLNDDELLEAFYSADNEKLKKAKYHWGWNRRGGVLGFPPQWPVSLKKCIYYGGGLLALGLFYEGYNHLEVSFEDF